jgi:hypothetical protein
MPPQQVGAEGVSELVGFREGLYRCLRNWGDALFELCDAALCATGPISSVPGLSMEPVFRRSHGSLYKALSRGRIEEDQLRALLVAHRPANWPLIFAVDASTWARCDAECSPERGFYYSASKHSAGQPIVAGWNYQWICQLNWAHDSWTAPLDVMRITPFLDATTATVEQVRRLVGLLPVEGEVPLFVFDAGYDPIAIGHDLADVRCEVLTRIRDDRVFYGDPPPRPNRPRGPVVVPRGTEECSSAQIGPPGESPTTALSRLTPAMAPSECRPGMVCTRSSRGEGIGRLTTPSPSCAPA